MKILQSIKCWIASKDVMALAHWHVLRRVSKNRFGTEKIKCDHCNRFFAMIHSCMVVLDWDDEFERFFEKEEQFFKRWGIK